jgi:hypothetical protein
VTQDAVRAALIKRLRTFSGIAEEDINEILALPISVRQFPAETMVVHDGQTATECCLVANGFVCVPRRSATASARFCIPGKIPDLMSLFLYRMDHDLSTLGFINHATPQKLHRPRPNVAEVFWRDTLIDAAMFRDGSSMSVNVQRPRALRTCSPNCVNG